MREEKSFFSFIQQASIEKCHSAALAWLFSDSNSHFSEDVKRGILSEWCQAKVGGKPEKATKAINEYKNIDILIKCDDAVVGSV